MDLMKVHRSKDGQPMEVARESVSLIESDPDTGATVITLILGQTSREVVVRESYDEVVHEYRLTSVERAIRSLEADE